MGDGRDAEPRSWLSEALSRRIRHPALEQTLFHQLEELQRGPLERLAELVQLVVDELRFAQRRLSDQAADLRSLQRALAELQERVGRLETDGAAPAAAPGHLLLVPGANGYRLVPGEEPAPAAGERVVVDGVALRVLRTGASPLPGDRRRCALALPDQAPACAKRR